MHIYAPPMPLVQSNVRQRRNNVRQRRNNVRHRRNNVRHRKACVGEYRRTVPGSQRARVGA
eukprot:658809-Rhodomonas_salina.1